MNNRIISAPASELLELIRGSEVLRSLVEEHADLRELLIQAADAAAKSSELSRLFEVVALAACTSDRAVEVSCNEGRAELEEIKRLNARASETLGAILREFCPDARPIESNTSSLPN